MNKFLVLIFSFFLSLTTASAQFKSSEYLSILEAFSVEEMRAALLTAEDHGFNTKSYWSDSMESSFLREGALNSALKDQTKVAFLRFLQHLHSGVINPDLVGSDVVVRRKSFVDAKQFNVLSLVQAGSAQGLVESFAPQNPAYRGLQEAYKRVQAYCANDQWLPLPVVKKPLKLTSQDPVLPEIKNRLRQLGYPLVTIDDLFDQQTLDAVNDIQSTLHFRPDGVISPNGKTWKYLNTSCDARLSQIRLDMEKLRWFPRDFGDRYIYVNLAMTYLHLVDKTNGVNQVMKTINGRSQRKSPTMIDKITYIVINPFWVVPPTVFREDKVQDLRGLSGRQVEQYFAKGHYEVWNKSFSRRLSPSGINWNYVNGSSDIYIRQKPGLHNALGVLKFMMTNDIAIYLHDTNQRELFKDFERQLSSGCVRVEKPFDLAEQLLLGTKWDRTAIENQTAKTGEVPARDTIVNLAKPMPVYMVFQSSLLSSDGILRFAEDSYNQNARMLQTLK